MPSILELAETIHHSLEKTHGARKIMKLINQLVDESFKIQQRTEKLESYYSHQNIAQQKQINDLLLSIQQGHQQLAKLETEYTTSLDKIESMLYQQNDYKILKPIIEFVQHRKRNLKPAHSHSDLSKYSSNPETYSCCEQPTDFQSKINEIIQNFEKTQLSQHQKELLMENLIQSNQINQSNVKHLTLEDILNISGQDQKGDQNITSAYNFGQKQMHKPKSEFISKNPNITPHSVSPLQKESFKINKTELKSQKYIYPDLSPINSYKSYLTSQIQQLPRRAQQIQLDSYRNQEQKTKQKKTEREFSLSNKMSAQTRQNKENEVGQHRIKEFKVESIERANGNSVKLRNEGHEKRQKKKHFSEYNAAELLKKMQSIIDDKEYDISYLKDLALRLREKKKKGMKSTKQNMTSVNELGGSKNQFDSTLLQFQEGQDGDNFGVRSNQVYLNDLINGVSLKGCKKKRTQSSVEYDVSQIRWEKEENREQKTKFEQTMLHQLMQKVRNRAKNEE